MNKNFSGIFTALITPFSIDGKIDEKALELLVKRQIKAQVNGIIVGGTTGESVCLTSSEICKILEIAHNIIKSSNSKMKLIAGCTSSSTNFCTDMVTLVAKCGADAAMIAPPPYVKPSERDVYEHFTKASKNSPIPILIYNIPSRASFDMSNKLVKSLIKNGNFIGIKDCSGDLTRISELANLKNFSHFCGDDALLIAQYAMGSHGIISVLSNIFPEIIIKIHQYCLNNDFKEARILSNQIAELNALMFCEPNPAPVKYTASLFGLCQPLLRQPFNEISDHNKHKIKEILENLELIKSHSSGNAIIF